MIALITIMQIATTGAAETALASWLASWLAPWRAPAAFWPYCFPYIVSWGTPQLTAREGVAAR